MKCMKDEVFRYQLGVDIVPGLQGRSLSLTLLLSLSLSLFPFLISLHVFHFHFHFFTVFWAVFAQLLADRSARRGREEEHSILFGRR